MSDQIKTQHGTIGLLMAECEQLRRDLKVAQDIQHAEKAILLKEIEDHTKTKADLAQAKAEIERLRQQISSEKVKP